MSEKFFASFVPALVTRYYGAKVVGVPELMHERDGQQVFYVELANDKPLTVRLCPPDRPKSKVLADSGALYCLEQADFPAPRLRMTLSRERVFEWWPGSWGYAQEFIEGENPEYDLPTLAEV